MRPKVSVVIPAFNAELYIETAIYSVLQQTVNDVEVIVVDDCSTDSTAKRVRAISDSRLIFMQEPRNLGPSRARNRALSVAKGEWIAFLDADDWYAPQRLEILLRVVSEWGGDLVADDMYRTEGPSMPPVSPIFPRRVLSQPAVIDAAGFLSLNSGLQAMIRLDFIRTHEIVFDERLRNGEDNLFILECLLDGGRLVLWPQPLYYYRLCPGSLSSHKLEAMKQRQMITQELLERESLRLNPRLSELLQKRLYHANNGMVYYQVVDYLKKRRIVKAVLVCIYHPVFIKIIYQKFIDTNIYKFRLLFRKYRKFNT